MGQTRIGSTAGSSSPVARLQRGFSHANLETLRFPDINGDGRADYVYIGEHGSLKHYMNTGSLGGQDVLFQAMGGIATGAVDEISQLVFADVSRSAQAC